MQARYTIFFRVNGSFSLTTSLTGVDAIDARLQGEDVVICAVQKDELRYIDEWVDYHLALGFAKLYVYDNSDDSEAVIKWKQERSDGDSIEVIPFPGEKVQVNAYKSCADRVIRIQHTWVFFADIDEFLVLKKHSDVLTFAHEYVPAGQLGINWQVFGTAGRSLYEPYPVTLRFQCRLPETYGKNVYIKSLVRVSDLNSGEIFDPHFFPLRNNGTLGFDLLDDGSRSRGILMGLVTSLCASLLVSVQTRAH